MLPSAAMLYALRVGTIKTNKLKASSAQASLASSLWTAAFKAFLKKAASKQSREKLRKKSTD